jgi:hypothetical protein
MGVEQMGGRDYGGDSDELGRGKVEMNLEEPEEKNDTNSMLE